MLRELTGSPHFTPCALLAGLVAQSKLGRKTGEGFHSYAIAGGSHQERRLCLNERGKGAMATAEADCSSGARAELQDAALGAAAALQQFGHVNADGHEAAFPELVRQPLGLLGNDHMKAVGQGVETEYLGIGRVRQDGVRELFRKQRPALREEGLGVVHDLVVVEHGESRVEVVVPLVDQRQAQDRLVEELPYFVVRLRLTAETWLTSSRTALT